jgi:hypothetical protein
MLAGGSRRALRAARNDDAVPAIAGLGGLERQRMPPETAAWQLEEPCTMKAERAADPILRHPPLEADLALAHGLK